MTQHKFKIALYLAVTLPIAALMILAVAPALELRALTSVLQWLDHALRNLSVQELASKSRALSITCYLLAFAGVCFVWFARRHILALSKKFEQSINAQQLPSASAQAMLQHDLEQAGLLQRAIFNSANFSSIATDARGVIQIFNVGAERMLGYEAAEVINKLSPADISDSQELIARSVCLSEELQTPIAPGFDALVFKASRGIEDIYELTYVRKDGSRFPAVVSVTALRDAQDSIIGYLLIGTDNTARRQAETDLRRSDDQLRTLFAGVKDYAILMLDPEGCVVTWNEVAQSIKGYRADEIIGCHFSRFYTPEAIAQGVPAKELRIAAEHGRFEDESWRVRKDGSKFYANVVLTALLDPSGLLRGFGKVTRDITSRKQAEEEATALLRTIHLHSIVSVADRAGRIIEVNDSFCAISGYTRDELLNHTHRIVNSGVHSREFWTEMWEHLSSDKSWRGEICNRAKNGTLYWIDSIIAPFSGEGGRTTKYISIHTDITAAKLSEGRLRMETQKAEVASNAKSDFLANMSPEIRTPMNAILGMTHLALRAQPSEQQRRYLGKIESASQSLLTIMNDILDFSKIEAGKLELENINLSLDEVWRNLLNIVGQKAEQKKLAIVLEVDPSTPGYFKGDPLRLGQILINLVNNAIKFTDRGEIVVKVMAEPSSPGHAKLKFSVRDTGIGMSPDQMSGLFQSFNQADTSITRTYGGTGLGLAISKQLCELMGGTISAESEPGKGSTFVFTAIFETTVLGVLPTPRSSSTILPGKSILVADDSEADRNMLVAMLMAHGFDTRAVSSGEEALSALIRASEAGHPFDLVIMDWRLPGIDGIETSRRIQAHSDLSQLPFIVMVSAFNREEVMGGPHGLDLDGFLLKPVNEGFLLNKLAMILDDRPRNTVSDSRDILVEPTLDLATRPLAGRKVLLVEDNELNRDLATELLGDLGITVAIAVNGREGVDRVASEPFDLVLMDIQMPVLDGLSATRLIRKDSRFLTLPIIAMTAHAMGGDRERSLEAGLSDHLTKPIDPDTLTKTLVHWMPAKPAMHLATADLLPKPAEADAPLPEQLPPFDIPSALARANGKPKLLRKLMRGFVQLYANVGADLRCHLAQDRTADAERLAHSLKSIAAMLEARELTATAKAVELALRAGLLEQASALIDTLEDALGPAIDAARSLEGNSSAVPASNAAGIKSVP